MTTDPFTEAAQDEAVKRWPHLPHRPETHVLNVGKRVGFDLGASWARTHLAAQEPTDAEVEAAATAGLDAVSPTWRASMSRPMDDDLAFSRAALIHARAARRDEEQS